MYACVVGLQWEESCLEGQTHSEHHSNSVSLNQSQSLRVTAERHQINDIIFQQKKKKHDFLHCRSFGQETFQLIREISCLK